MKAMQASPAIHLSVSNWRCVAAVLLLGLGAVQAAATDISNIPINSTRILQAKPNIMVLMSIGGFSWSGRFSDAATPDKRVAFVKTCIDLFIRGNLPIWAYVSGGTPTGSVSKNRAWPS